MSTHGLPLTENVQPRAPITAAQEAEIADLIATFYGRVLQDALLGPIFNKHVKDWDAHFPRMQDFWASVVYKVGRYAGNPLQVHRALGDLDASHFQRWLMLWEQTVQDQVKSDIGPSLILNAQRMGQAMSARLEQDRRPEAQT